MLDETSRLSPYLQDGVNTTLDCGEFALHAKHVIVEVVHHSDDAGQTRLAHLHTAVQEWLLMSAFNCKMDVIILAGLRM